MQKAIEVVGGEDRTLLVSQLQGRVIELLESRYGNYVLQKCVEVLPPHIVQFVVEELKAYPGSWAVLAKHQYGCRVMQRLLEHCPEHITSALAAEVVIDAAVLSRHPFGNYVVQHVLEHSSKQHRLEIVSALLPDLVALAQDRVASNVVERALETSGPEGQQALANVMLSDPSTLVFMGCSKYGAYSVRRLLEVLPAPARSKALEQLCAGTQQLNTSRHGRSLIEDFKLRTL